MARGPARVYICHLIAHPHVPTEWVECNESSFFFFFFLQVLNFFEDLSVQERSDNLRVVQVGSALLYCVCMLCVPFWKGRD
jgi:hypothetical protein